MTACYRLIPEKTRRLVHSKAHRSRPSRRNSINAADVLDQTLNNHMLKNRSAEVPALFAAMALEKTVKILKNSSCHVRTFRTG